MSQSVLECRNEKYTAHDNDVRGKRCKIIRGVVDSGNNKYHVFNDISLFPKGVKYVNIKITGVHGTETVRVGMGTAYFATECTNGTTKRWRSKYAIYNDSSPVNLICMNKILYADGNHTIETGYDVSFKTQSVLLKK